MLSTLRHFTDWSRYGVCEGLASQESLKNGFVVESKSISPLSQGQRFALILYQLARHAIPGLRRFYHPRAVSGFVIAIVIGSLNAVLAAGARPHVCVEILKGMQPAITNANSTVVVPAQFIGLWECAARNHVSPASIFTGSKHPVFQLSSADRFSIQAAAAFYGTRPKIAGPYKSCISTITLAKPFHAIAFDNRKPCKLPTSQVFKSTHGCSPLCNWKGEQC